MTARRWRQVEADVRRFYGVDAIDVGCRRLLVYVDGLPECATTGVVDGWDAGTELAAAQLEMTHQIVTVLGRLGGNKRRVRPLRLPRPYEHRERPVDRLRGLAKRLGMG